MAEDRSTQKVREITDKLEQGIAELFDSERYREYLRTMSKFYNYSFSNTLLIAMQKPDATLIAGYTSWQRNFDRHVLKGEKGIKILAPAPYKAQMERDRLDPATNNPVLDTNGDPMKETVEVVRPAFKVVSVFDVSQTEGRELPDIGVDELTGNVQNYAAFFEALRQVSPVLVAFEDIPREAKGYYHIEEHRIAIQKDMSEIQTVKTAIHEIAHARLHAYDKAKDVPPEERKDGRTREVEAESVAYTVCQHYGIETSDYSFGYIAGWSSGKETKELKGSLETIRKTATDMIDGIDEKLKVLLVEKEQPAPEKEAIPEKPVSPERPGWRVYIISDLCTWANNAEVRAPIEYYDTFDEARDRFLALRNDKCNALMDGRAHLTMGVSCRDRTSDADILHVRNSENYLVDDFTRMTKLNTDPDVLDILHRAASEIGFDRVIENIRGADGKYLPPKDRPFGEWENPYFRTEDKTAEAPTLAARLNDFAKDVDPYAYRDACEIGQTDEDNIRELESQLKDPVSAARIATSLEATIEEGSLTDEQLSEASRLAKELHGLLGEKEPESKEMNILEMVDSFMDQGMTEDQANTLADLEWQARQPVTDEKAIKAAVMDKLKQQISVRNDGIFASYKSSPRSDKLLFDNHIRIDGDTVLKKGTPLFHLQRRYASRKTQGCYRELNPVLEPVGREKQAEKPSIRDQLRSAAQEPTSTKKSGKSKSHDIEMG